MTRRITDKNIPACWMFRILLMFSLALFVTHLIGCVGSQLPIQYATAQLIERGTVTPAEVVVRTDRVRALVEDGVTLNELGGRVRDEIGYVRLAPSDRLLIDAILGDVAHRLDSGFDIPLDAGSRDAILEALDSIDRVAALY